MRKPSKYNFKESTKRELAKQLAEFFFEFWTKNPCMDTKAAVSDLKVSGGDSLSDGAATLVSKKNPSYGTNKIPTK